MLDTATVAQQLQTGLNALNTLENTEFIVIPDVAKFKRSKRVGNVVTNYINCVLTDSPNANETANGGLLIAVDQYMLDVYVPLDQIKTTPDEDPQPWNDGINVYAQTVKSIINSYFAINQTGVITKDKKTYTVGYTYTASSIDSPMQYPGIGRAVSFNASITALIVQNGLNSMDVTLTVNGKIMPYQSITPNRNVVSVSDVWSNSTSVKNMQTATAIAIDVSTPALSQISEAGKWLLEGTPGRVYIVGLTWKDDDEYKTQYWLMQLNSSRWSSESVANVGETYSFVEAPYLPDILDYSDALEVTTYSYTSIVDANVNALASAAYDRIFVLPGGDIVEVAKDTTETFPVNESNLFYNDGKYYAYLVTCNKVDVYGQSV